MQEPTKIYISDNKYLLPYQLTHIKRLANKERFSSTQFRDIVTEFVRYNFISDFLENCPDCGALIWDADEEEVCFELSKECGIFEALLEEGFSVYPN